MTQEKPFVNTLVDSREKSFSFPGYSFRGKPRFPRQKSHRKFVERIRELTPRKSDESLAVIIQRINRATQDWFNYSRHCHWSIFRDYDGMIRRRSRRLLLKRNRRNPKRLPRTRRWPNAYFTDAKNGLYAVDLPSTVFGPILPMPSIFDQMGWNANNRNSSPWTVVPVPLRDDNARDSISQGAIPMKSTLQLPIALLIACMLIPAPLPAEEPPAARSVFARDNLVAWCIVPFDAKDRNPQQRAEMLVRLGLRKLAYDWRRQHVPTFEEEIRQMKRHGIEFFAFWGIHPEFTALMQKHGIRPRIWVMMRAPAQGTQEHKVEEAARRLLPLGSGVTEAACKTVFTQRLKLSGMGWTQQGAGTILRLRVILLSGIWDDVYEAATNNRNTIHLRTYAQKPTAKLKNAA